MGTKMNMAQAISQIQSLGPITQNLELAMRPKMRLSEIKLEIKAKGSLIKKP